MGAVEDSGVLVVEPAREESQPNGSVGHVGNGHHDPTSFSEEREQAPQSLDRIHDMFEHVDQKNGIEARGR